MSTWTAERRARHAKLIHQWRPWERSTGPRTPEGKARSARNSYRGGQRVKCRALIRALNAVLKLQLGGLSQAFKEDRRAHS